MLARLFATGAALAFAIGAFCGAGPTRVQPNPFGIFFLAIAAFVWFGWKRIQSSHGGPAAFDALTGNFVERDGRSSGPIVPEQDTTGRRRRD